MEPKTLDHCMAMLRPVWGMRDVNNGHWGTYGIVSVQAAGHDRTVCLSYGKRCPTLRDCGSSCYVTCRCPLHKSYISCISNQPVKVLDSSDRQLAVP